MKPRYTEEVTIKFARQFLRAHFDGVRIPWGSRCLWLAGVQYVTDQPGVYLISAAGGLCGIQITTPAVEQAMEAAG